MMIGRSKLWLAIASLFTLVNLGGALFALAQGEPRHGALHIALTIAGMYATVWLWPRASRPRDAMDDSTSERLERLQQSLDVIAIEVERIGEAQRFQVKLAQEQSATER